MKQHIKRIARQHPRKQFATTAQWVIDKAIAIQQIPGPTFAEAERAAMISQQFAELALDDIRIDAVQNVYGRMPGANPDLPALMLMAHTDTVFPAETDLTIQHNGGGTIYGPGLGDNSIGVAGMLGLAYALKTLDVQPPCDLWFVATSREEGLGNLDGARLAFETLREHIHSVINVEGLAFGYVYNAGICVRRLHVKAIAQGGHSWLHFGRASATHTIMQIGSQITQITPPQQPRTTYNIGIIDGGHSINSIASEASLWLDLRSEDAEALANLERTVRTCIQEHQSTEIEIQIEVVGDRPAGQISAQHPLVQGALHALEETGVRGSLQIGSTDGNIPLSYGYPTVTVGITRGGNAHRLDEFIEIGPVESGMQQLFVLTLAAAASPTQVEA